MQRYNFISVWLVPGRASVLRCLHLRDDRRPHFIVVLSTTYDMEYHKIKCKSKIYFTKEICILLPWNIPNSAITLSQSISQWSFPKAPSKVRPTETKQDLVGPITQPLKLLESLYKCNFYDTSLAWLSDAPREQK